MIVITAPTGAIGHQVLDRVLDSGEPIRVIARDPSRLPAHVRERSGLDNFEPRTPQATTPTTFREWCEDTLKPAVQC
jgi:uncharacterized protein YbjT (DUF2867 family)